MNSSSPKLQLAVLVLSLFMVTSVTANLNVLRVTGRAVDERGKPLAGAIATLYYAPCRDCIDQILPVGYSLEDGVFFVELTDDSLKDVRLFIEEQVPEGFWSPLGSPPFERLSHHPEFQGRPIKSRGNSTIHLGDVRVRIRYSRLIIDLSRLIPWYAPNQETAGALSLSLKDDRGKLIYNGSLPNVAFDPTFSSLNLALTNGKWAMQFFLPNQGPRVRSLRLTVVIKTSGCTKITADNGRKSYRRCE